jgi:sigma-B regulation protein RsbU (phosphoserine phosphatase)
MHLAEQFARVARPQTVAVGLAKKAGYSWEIISGPKENGFNESLQIASQRADGTDSDIQSWCDGYANEETPNPASPYCILFPMKGRAGVIGHVYVHRPRLLPMPPPLQRYLSLYANYAGLLWENLQVIALRNSQKQMEAELDQARQIQIELFPPTFEVDPRLDTFAINLPSVHVSGDYYDLVRTGPDTLAFVIADAMGHGMPAALMMASVRATLRMGLTLGLPWDALFRGVDNIIAQAKVMSFVTGIVGQVDLAERELQLVIAGHHPPSILIGDKPVEVPDDCITRPWGVDFDCNWQVGRIPLGVREWSVLCYTDGVTEAMVADQKAFGSRRVEAYHSENRRESAEDLCQGLLSVISDAQQSVSLADDQTVLVLRSR